MAFSSLLGGGIYYFLSEQLFLYSTIIMLIVTIGSIIFLPQIRITTSNKPRNFIQKQDFLILIKKFNLYKKTIFLFILLSLYFQIIIQYWQVVIHSINETEKNGLILGFILFLMFTVQSLAGKTIEKKYQISDLILAFAFLVSVLLAFLAEKFQSVIFYTLGLCLALFVVRYTIIQTDIELHSHLLSRFRAKYDMLLNSIVRILTSVTLVAVGYLSNIYGIQSIQIIGLGIAIIFILLALIPSNTK